MIQWIAILFLAMQVGCAMKMKKDSPPTPSEDTAVWAWETKASVKDLRKNKMNQITIDVVSIKNQKLRMEASATLGYQVGTLVMGPTDFVAVIYPQKKIFKGPLNEKSLVRTFNMPIPPAALYSIAYDEAIKGANWKCQYDPNRWISVCDGGTSKVEWLNRKEGSKLIKITSATVEINWFFKAPERKELTAELFEAEMPSGYEVQEVK